MLVAENQGALFCSKLGLTTLSAPCLSASNKRFTLIDKQA
jgi:hypothetical protein